MGKTRAVCLVLLLASGLSQAQTDRGAARPNLVLITIDTLRADRLGCYGYRPAETPQIDALARESLRFTTVVAQAPLTLPSHCTILTGVLPPVHQVRDNVGYRLAAGQTTLAEMLRASGYRTGAVVGSYVLHSKFGLNQGFDFYDNVSVGKTAGIVNLNQLERRASEVVDSGIRWIGQNRKSPFFLWLHLYDPHDPYAPPPPFDARFKGRGYDGEIAYCDEQVGRLIGFLKTEALYAGTVVTLTGDHGESFGEHGEYTHGYFLYDTTLLVPLVIKPAGQSRAGVVATQVSTVDILPTLLELIRVPAPRGVQGQSLLPLAAGKPPAAIPEAYSETYYPAQFGWSSLMALRRPPLKLIEAPRPELYDLARDPGELANVLAKRPEERAAMEKRLAGMSKPSGSAPAATMILSREERDQLAALGYVSGPVPARGGKPADPKDKLDVFNLVSEAGQAAARGKCSDAVPMLRKVLAREPDMAAAQLLLGRCLFDEGQFEAARPCFGRVLETSPGNHDALFFLAACDFYLKRYEPAETALKKLLLADPEYVAAHKYLGFLYQERGQLPLAVAAFGQAARINPDDEEAQAKLGFLFASQSQFAEAVAHYSRAARLNPKNAATRYNLGLAYLRTGQEAKGQAELKEACRLDKRYCRGQ